MTLPLESIPLETPLEDAAPPLSAGGPAVATEAAAVLRTEVLTKSYLRGGRRVTALREVSLSFCPGELSFVLGPSGSGKSTLLHLLGALDRPTDGEVWLGDHPLSRLPDDQRARLRRERLGFVFQSFHLLDTLPAVDNVLIARVPEGVRAEDRARARMLLERLGLGDRLTHRPNELSGGEQQRVAIARALFRDPPVVLADEPTGELDSVTGREILGLLRASARDQARTVVIITHDASLLEAGDRVIRLRDGGVVADERLA